MARRIQRIDERLRANNTATVFLRRIKSVVNDCVRLATSDNCPPDTKTYCITRLESLERNILRSRSNILNEDFVDIILSDIKQLLEEFRKESGNSVGASGYQAERNDFTKGAPRFAITEEQLRFLIRIGFNTPQMADILGVSVKTVKRRFKTFGIRLRDTYTDISQADLDETIRQILGNNQRVGPNSVRARLLGQNIKVQRWRVRESMNRNDPGSAALRSVQAIQRRTYTVAGPNSVWYIDGNLKLCRWRIVIHGGIDGCSRMLVFLGASDRNTKEVVTEHFLTAVATYGVPSRVRVDYGGENNEICHIMELIRGDGRSSSIRGKSVNNQRIERLWVDTWNGFTNVYYDMFHFLERRGSLDVENEIHLWALHYVFFPRINRDLNRFRSQWNNHGIRTQKHLTPVQLFVQQSLKLYNTNLTAIQDFFSEPLTQDVIHRLSTEHNTENVATAEIPSIRCPLSDEDLQHLRGTIDPLNNNSEHGLETYCSVVEFVNNILTRSRANELE